MGVGGLPMVGAQVTYENAGYLIHHDYFKWQLSREFNLIYPYPHFIFGWYKYRKLIISTYETIISETEKDWHWNKDG